MGVMRALVVGVAIAVGGFTPVAHAQFPPVAPPAAIALPEPIYWKQNLFLIPYQWSSAADPGAAQAVLLFVSNDFGANWQKISEAKPQVKAFNYHAAGDGEYWFAIRTLDRNGQPQPTGPYQPELRVIVDTTMPRIEALAAQLRSDGALELQWRGSDQNLDASSWKMEVQLDATETWHPVPLAGLHVIPIGGPAAQVAPGASDGQTAWQPPAGSRPRALRATVYDRAGNSAAYGAVIAATADGNSFVNQVPALPNSRGAASVGAAEQQNLSGWVSPSDVPPAAPQVTDQSAAQPWPAGAVSSAPFRLSAGAGQGPGDGKTSYGTPSVVSAPQTQDSNFAAEQSSSPAQVQFGYAAASQPADNVGPPQQPAVTATSSNFSPLEPFREAAAPLKTASVKRLPAIDGGAAPLIDGWPAQPAPQPPTIVVQPPAGIELKRVGSRKFALEYELEESGRWGVATVELWGTRDGGQTWRRYATDDDNRSPLVAAVDDEGMYGFRIVVESAGGTSAASPRPGDAPELWVAVDLEQPVAELTSIEPGSGNLADHLILRWRADDDNLEPRPIALFYSTRPAGPWSAIATNLANTGEYAWQAGRHVPERFYLRLEARDTAGNLAAFQTREPVILPAAAPSGRLRDVEPLGPTAAGVDAGYR